MTIEAIKEAIQELPADEKTSLAAWLLEQDLREWDKQLEQDFSPGGGGMALLEEVDAQINAGNFEPFKVTRPRGKE